MEKYLTLAGKIYIIRHDARELKWNIAGKYQQAGEAAMNVRELFVWCGIKIAKYYFADRFAGKALNPLRPDYL